LRLASILLVLIAGMFYLDNPIATFYANKIAAAKAWEYILKGVGLSVLFSILGILARNPVVWMACLWGFVESLETSICRLSYPIGGDPPVVPLFHGLCGPNFYFLGLCTAAFIAVKLAKSK